MCSVEFTLLKWDWDIQSSGQSYNSRKEISPNTGLASFPTVFVNDQPSQRIFLYISALYGIVLKILYFKNNAITSGASKSYMVQHCHQCLGKLYIHKTILGQANTAICTEISSSNQI